MEKINKKIENRLSYGYLSEHLCQPVIDNEKLFLLVSLMNNNSTLSSFQKEKFIIAAMLMQIALDTHELSGEDEIEKEYEAEVKKQLSVLAGDYFSGLYYRLLSEIKEIDFIRVLATATKEVNEYKMKLYYKEANSLEEAVNYLGKIDALIVENVAEYLNDPSIIPVINNWLLVNKLLQIKEKINDNKGTFLNYWLVNSATSDRSFQTLDDIIKISTENLKVTLERLSSVQYTPLKTHIMVKLETLLYHDTKIAKEG